MRNVECYPAEVVAVRVNGGAPQPNTPPGPASSFTYDLDVTMDNGVQRFEGVSPGQDRIPDELDSVAIESGTLVNTFLVGGVIVMDARERHHYTPCQPPPRRALQ